MNDEDLIWDLITEKAKAKFDYAKFENHFKEIYCNDEKSLNEQDLDDENTENIAENILFLIIASLASGHDKSIISAKIFNEIILTGFVWEIEKIEKFIEDKEELFYSEIYCFNLAMSMLENGEEIDFILVTMGTFL